MIQEFDKCDLVIIIRTYICVCMCVIIILRHCISNKRKLNLIYGNLIFNKAWKYWNTISFSFPLLLILFYSLLFSYYLYDLELWCLQYTSLTFITAILFFPWYYVLIVLFLRSVSKKSFIWKKSRNILSYLKIT